MEVSYNFKTLDNFKFYDIAWVEHFLGINPSKTSKR